MRIGRARADRPGPARGLDAPDLPELRCRLRRPTASMVPAGGRHVQCTAPVTRAGSPGAASRRRRGGADLRRRRDHRPPQTGRATARPGAAAQAPRPTTGPAADADRLSRLDARRAPRAGPTGRLAGRTASPSGLPIPRRPEAASAGPRGRAGGRRARARLSRSEPAAPRRPPGRAGRPVGGGVRRGAWRGFLVALALAGWRLPRPISRPCAPQPLRAAYRARCGAATGSRPGSGQPGTPLRRRGRIDRARRVQVRSAEAVIQVQ